MKWFKICLVFSMFLLFTGAFNTSFVMADETATDSSQITEPADEGYNQGGMEMEDENYNTDEGESMVDDQDEVPAETPDDSEEYVE
jgi:hypothetical protein